MGSGDSVADAWGQAGPAVEAAAARVEARLRPAFTAFARILLGGLGEEEVAGALGVAPLVGDFFDLVRQRRPGEIRARIRSPEDRPGRAVIELIQEDRPFLVDTLRLFLRDHGFRERLLLHPLLPALRDDEGQLLAIADAGAAPLESLLLAEVTPGVADDERIARLVDVLRERMERVRDVTEDHEPMLGELRAVKANLLRASRFLDDGEPRAAKIGRFLDWLMEGNFVFLGFRRYELSEAAEGEPELALARGRGLGLFREDETSVLREPLRGEDIPEELRDFLEDPRVIVIDKSRVQSPVQRGGRLDRIALKEHDDAGRVVGIALAFGLFTSRALRTPASQIPLLAERLAELLVRDGTTLRSHRHKAIVSAFDAAPVEFLLTSDVDGILGLIREIVDAEGSRATRVVLRKDRRERSLYAAVLVPRERYGEDLRRRIRDHLEERVSALTVDDRVSFIEEGTAALHFFCTAGTGRLRVPEARPLAREIASLAARWEDRFAEALAARFGEGPAIALAARYEHAFPEGLRLLTDPWDAVRDVEALEALHESGLPQLAFYFDRGDPRGETNIVKLYLSEGRLLSDLLPMVDHFGIAVVDAQQSVVSPLERERAVVQTLRVLPLGAVQEDLDALAPRLGEAMVAVLCGVAGDDEFNGLVLGAGLDFRQVDCLRAWVDYTMQIQGTLTRPFVRGTLLGNPTAARLLVHLHEARFDPSLADGERARREEELRAAFEHYRERILSLNEDRALAGLLAIVEAMLRTNFFVPERGPRRVAFKLDPSRLPELDPPRPYREIFVHSPAMMGVHLRAGAVARGGIRFSDRSEDLRVEILGLMRTQNLKNGLIVPVGAKGGFVLRNAGSSPAETRRLADAQYGVFIESLLDLTDGVDAEGRVQPRAHVVRRDGDDPYLVVAADKGTAHLSDVANGLARERDFWLGDAFASGGSEGYDHKHYGITARGAWECAKHHFAELGIDAEGDSYTVAGIGDMSGDVFGNGLLLMRRAQLVAAFDHRHVFLDPDPDPEVSYEERRRLKALPSSSWDDYDRSKLSPGGGVYPRTARRIDLSREARQRLGIASAWVTGNDLVRAILALEVDLLWCGGIGTYVKASRESHADAGDRANDAVRIDARALRARVVAEGANLGLTQAARVEAARAGVRLDTDAIHNSGGVDLSDHEVNFKVLLAPLLRSEALSTADRRAALFAVAGEACERVVAHNRSQVLAISLDEVRSRSDLDAFLEAAELFCRATGVAAAELCLPDGPVIARRRDAGEGLVRPELAVLLGLAKLATRQSLAASPLVDHPAFQALFASYFPERLRSIHGEALAGHFLRREITALMLTNRLVDAGGATLVPSLAAELGVDFPRAAVAAFAAEEVLEAPLHRERLLAKAASLPRPLLYGTLVALDQGVRAVARFLSRSGWDAPDPARLAELRAGLATLRESLPSFLSAGEATLAEERRQGLEADGLPTELASDLAVLPLADRGLQIVGIAARAQVPVLAAAGAYARLGDGSGLNWLYQRLDQLPRADSWDRLAQVALHGELLDLQRELTEVVLAGRPADPVAAADAFLATRAPLLAGIRELQRRAVGGLGLQALLVIAGRLRGLRAAENESGS